MSIYTAAKSAGLEMDHHEGDLYLKDTPGARELLAVAGKKIDGRNVQPFRSAIDGSAWLDIPFAYDPHFSRERA